MQLETGRMAIIVVHMQNDVVGPEGAFGAFFAKQAAERDVAARISRLLATGRMADVTIVYLRIAYNADYSDLVANSPLLNMVKPAKCLVDGTPGAAIVDQLTPAAGDLVVTHQRPGGFAASQLDILLRSRDITTVAFAGVATNASVEGTARQASDLGYRTLIIEDACSTTDEAAHAASIQSLGLLAEVISADDLMAALSDAGVST